MKKRNKINLLKFFGLLRSQSEFPVTIGKRVTIAYDYIDQDTGELSYHSSDVMLYYPYNPHRPLVENFGQLDWYIQTIKNEVIKLSIGTIRANTKMFLKDSDAYTVITNRGKEIRCTSTLRSPLSRLFDINNREVESMVELYNKRERYRGIFVNSYGSVTCSTNRHKATGLVFYSRRHGGSVDAMVTLLENIMVSPKTEAIEMGFAIVHTDGAITIRNRYDSYNHAHNSLQLDPDQYGEKSGGVDVLMSETLHPLEWVSSDKGTELCNILTAQYNGYKGIKTN